MPERLHDHLVYQDIDLSKNKIKNIVALENTENDNAPTSISITAKGNIPIKSNSDSGVISITQGNNGAVLNINGDHDVSITKANSFSVERTGKSPATKFEIASDGDTLLTNAKDVSTSGNGDISFTTTNGNASIQVPAANEISLAKSGSTSLKIESDNDVIISGAKDFKSTGTGEINFKTTGTAGETNSKNATIEVPSDGNIILKQTGQTQLAIEADHDVLLTGAKDIRATGNGDIKIDNSASGAGGYLEIARSTGNTTLKGAGDMVIESIETNKTGKFSIVDGAPSIIGSSNALIEVPNTSTITIHQKDSNGASIGVDASHNITFSGASVTETGTSDVLIQNDASGATTGGHLKIEKTSGNIELISKNTNSATTGSIKITNGSNDGITLVNGVLTEQSHGDISIKNDDNTSGGSIYVTKSSGKVEIKSNGTSRDASIVMDDGKITETGINDILIQNDAESGATTGGHLKIEKTNGNIELKTKNTNGSTTGNIDITNGSGNGLTLVNGALIAKGAGAVSLQSTASTVSIEAKANNQSITLDSPNISLKSGNSNSKISIDGTQALSIKSDSANHSGKSEITSNYFTVMGKIGSSNPTDIGVQIYWDSATSSLVFEKV